MAVVLACSLSEPAAAGNRKSPTPEDVKAALLWNFALFVTWPDDAATDGPFVLGVYGGGGFEKSFRRAFDEKELRGRPAEVRRVERTDELADCDLLFVATEDEDDVRALLVESEGRGVLLVGNHPSFARRGGMIAFAVENQRVEFLVNLEEARRRGFRVSTKMLRLARLVETEREP